MHFIDSENFDLPHTGHCLTMNFAIFHNLAKDSDSDSFETL